jgi:hypothetical protein
VHLSDGLSALLLAPLRPAPLRALQHGGAAFGRAVATEGLSLTANAFGYAQALLEQIHVLLSSVPIGALTAGDDPAASVTQASSRATGVTLHGLSGTIVTNATSLAAGAEATFTVTNSRVKPSSIVLVTVRTPTATGLSVPAVTATDSIRLISGESHHVVDRNMVKIIQTPQTILSTHWRMNLGIQQTVILMGAYAVKFQAKLLENMEISYLNTGVPSQRKPMQKYLLNGYLEEKVKLSKPMMKPMGGVCRQTIIGSAQILCGLGNKEEELIEKL